MTTNSWARIWPRGPVAVGMLHLPPLPGAPRAALQPEEIWERTRAEAETLAAAGFDGLMLENHGDAPFFPEAVPPQVPALLGVLAWRLRREFGLPVGINVLRNDGFAGLAAALAAGAAFVRVNVLTGVTATDQGIVSGRAAELLRYRRAISCDALLLADVEVKYGTPLYRPEVGALARSTLERGGADAVIVSGSATGAPAAPGDLAAVRSAIGARPLLVGSGATSETLVDLAPHVDGFIVGTALKEGGEVEAPVEAARCRRFIEALRAAAPRP